MTWIQDAGHGGTDPGAVSNGHVEKDYTLEAAIYVNERLKSHKIQSGMTRHLDVPIADKSRAATVKKYKYCNSHHYNAGGGSGIEVIVSQHSNQKYAKMIIEEFKKAGFPVRPTPIFSKKGKDGKDYYFMHRLTGACQTVIIEYDFLDGPQSAKLKDKLYRESMYECVVKAVCRFENVPYKELVESSPKKYYRVVTGTYGTKAAAEKAKAEMIKQKIAFAAYIQEDK